MNNRSELEWKRSVDGHDDHAEQHQRDEVEHRLGDQGARAAPAASRASGPCAERAPSLGRARRGARAASPTSGPRPSSPRRRRGGAGDCGEARPSRSRTRRWRAGTSRPSSARSRSAPSSMSERTMLVDDLVDADPLRRDEGEPDADDRPRRRSRRRRAVRWRYGGARRPGSSVGSRRARTGAPAVGGTVPRGAGPLAARCGLGHRDGAR